MKRYIVEPGTPEVRAQIRAAVQVATSSITHVEVTAALARAARGGRLLPPAAEIARQALEADWLQLVHLDPAPAVLARAAGAAWNHRLRGYDAVHLASALHWQEILGEPVTVATFHRELWSVCIPAGLAAWPPDLAAFVPAP